MSAKPICRREVQVPVFPTLLVPLFEGKQKSSTTISMEMIIWYWVGGKVSTPWEELALVQALVTWINQAQELSFPNQIWLERWENSPEFLVTNTTQQRWTGKKKDPIYVGKFDHKKRIEYFFVLSLSFHLGEDVPKNRVFIFSVLYTNCLNNLSESVNNLIGDVFWITNVM